MSESARQPSKRSYRPKVEALEALRLLSSGLIAPLAPPPLADHQPLSTVAPIAAPSGVTTTDGAAWDAALGQTDYTDLIAPAGPTTTTTTVDADAVDRGLGQLNRYLGRAWARAGISPQTQDDCTQAVYTSLLQNLGRDGFDRLVGDVGRFGVRDVFSRDTPDGPTFFRAIDMVKKRTQRERSFTTLDDVQHDLSDGAGTDGASADWRGALHDAIARTLNPRETALIQDTLLGKTPAEIASQWGVAPKTVSNEKTRAIQKLRDALVADLTN